MISGFLLGDLHCYEVLTGICDLTLLDYYFQIFSFIFSFLVSRFFLTPGEAYRLLVDPNPELSCLVDENDELADDVEGPVQARPEFPSPLS